MNGTSIPYFQSLNRPLLFMGADKRFLLSSVALTLPIAWSKLFLSIWMDGIALALFIMLHAIGILIARADSQMLNLYKRHIRYADYYSPQACVGIQPKQPQLSVPIYEGMRGMV